MVITLIAHERNLGILTLTDFLIDKLGRDNSSVVGCNYLVKDISPILKKVEDFQSENKSVILKYVIPKMRFSDQVITYPNIIEEISDVVVRVPKFIEEVQKPINLEIFKGNDNPMIDRIKEFITKEGYMATSKKKSTSEKESVKKKSNKKKTSKKKTVSKKKAVKKATKKKVAKKTTVAPSRKKVVKKTISKNMDLPQTPKFLDQSTSSSSEDTSKGASSSVSDKKIVCFPPSLDGATFLKRTLKVLLSSGLNVLVGMVCLFIGTATFKYLMTFSFNTMSDKTIILAAITSFLLGIIAKDIFKDKN